MASDDEQHTSSSPKSSSAKSQSPPKSVKAPKRACDCCRKRKVRCDGDGPCGPCKKAGIKCAYLQPPKKKGPKGLRSARVLHELRRIDEADHRLPVSPLSPTAYHGTLNNWSWSSASSTSPVITGPPPAAHPPVVLPGFSDSLPAATSVPPASAPSSQGYFGPTAHPSVPPPQNYTRFAPVEPHQQQHWSSASNSSHSYDASRVTPSPPPLPSVVRLPSDMFLPYVQLFFDHIYTIMPVIDRHVYLNPELYHSAISLTSESYAFLCALSAATIVQLDAAAHLPPFVIPPGIPPADSPAELFTNECLRERSRFDYIEHPTTMTVMVSFFLFAFYGNKEQHPKAWHYLQESISFAQTLELDDENAIVKLDPAEGQWRRRLYWLLFVTERAYAIQRRKQTRLHASIQLPLVFESEDPQLLNGFVNLVHLFSAIDDNFVRVWRGARRGSLCDGPWLADTQRSLDGVALALENITETQHLDIGVTREWLHVLAWQMGVSNGLIWGKGEGGMRLEYPVELARRVVGITGGANRLALDSHGIGMEQKLSDIAGCLADVLKCAAGDTSQTFSQGREYLHLLLRQLSQMRGKESRYLRPLMTKMDDLLGFELTRSLPPPALSLAGDEGFEQQQQQQQQQQQAAMSPTAGAEARFGAKGLGIGLGLGLLGRVVEAGNGTASGLVAQGMVFDEDETRLMGSWIQAS